MRKREGEEVREGEGEEEGEGKKDKQSMSILREAATIHTVVLTNYGKAVLEWEKEIM